MKIKSENGLKKYGLMHMLWGAAFFQQRFRNE